MKPATMPMNTKMSSARVSISMASPRIVSTGGLPSRWNVQRAPIRRQRAFAHHLRKRRVWEDGAHQVFLGGLQLHGDDEALDELGNLGADHVGADQLAGARVEDGFDETVALAQRQGFAIGAEGKPA